MDEEFGASYIELVDDNGEKFQLEHLDTFQLDGEEYMVFLPADMDEDDPDYGLIILRVDEADGEEMFASIDDDDEKDKVYEYYMNNLFGDEDETDDEGEQG